MKKLKSNINANSEAFAENASEMLKLVEKLEKHLQEARFQGKEKHIEKGQVLIPICITHLNNCSFTAPT